MVTLNFTRCSFMISLAGYDFAQNKACLCCVHCMAGQPVLIFFHDDDGDLQASCGSDDHGDEDWAVVDLQDIVDRHPDLRDLPTVRLGEVVERASPGEAWV